MTIPLSSLREASFWDKVVCLSCGGIQPDDTDPDDHDCLFCSSPDIFPASVALKIFSSIDADEEET